MLTLKKTAVAVLAFGSSAVFAGSMGPVCTPGMVTVPCARTAWDFGAQALYLDVGTGTGDYAGWKTNNAGGANAIKPSQTWGWGFQIEGSYHFNTGNDVNLNWYHLDRSGSNLTRLSSSQQFNDNLSNSLWGSGVSANGSVNWDAVNLEFGQQVNFAENVNTRFYGGISYARVKAKQTLSGYMTNNGVGTVVNSAVVESGSLSYNGVGPRIGADSFYDWNNGFAVYAKGAMALFAGQSKITGLSTNGILTNPAGQPVFSAAGSTTQVVPELEAKLGGTYTYAMAQGDLSVDLGWMWINYFNPLNDSQMSSDFNLQGPYVGLKWVGNVA